MPDEVQQRLAAIAELQAVSMSDAAFVVANLPSLLSLLREREEELHQLHGALGDICELLDTPYANDHERLQEIDRIVTDAMGGDQHDTSTGARVSGDR